MELIDKAAVVAEIKGCEKICENYMSLHKDTVSQGIANAKRAVCQHFIKFINTLEVKEVDLELYKQGWKDAVEKACKFIKERISFEDSWHVEGETSILDKVIEDFKKYMEEQ